MTGPSTDSAAPNGAGKEAVRWVAKLLIALGSALPEGPSGKWQCPAHARTGAHAPSLGVGVRDDGGVGGVWVHCHAGCTTTQVCHALGLTLDHLTRPPRLSAQAWIRTRRLQVGFPAPKVTAHPRARGLRHEAFHSYGPRFCLERLRHPVTGEKAVEWHAVNPQGEWVPGLLGTRIADLPLYRENDLAMAVGAGETVLVVESESSVDALNRAGWYATTWAGGAGAPPCERLATLLAGHDQVVVIGDADGPGRACAAKLAETLPGAVVMFSERDGEDARDLLDRLGAAGLSARITAATQAAHAARSAENTGHPVAA